MPEDIRVTMSDVVPNPYTRRDRDEAAEWIEDRIINALFPNPGDFRRAVIMIISLNERGNEYKEKVDEIVFWRKLYGKK